jgi:hypothetical protein
MFFIRRNGNGSQYADNGDDDQQFNQCKTSLLAFLNNHGGAFYNGENAITVPFYSTFGLGQIEGIGVI